MKATAWTAALFGWGVLVSNVLFWFFPGAFLGLGVYGASQRALQVSSAQPVTVFSPADFTAVLLAVATIVLATVAFFVSIGAFIGFGETKRFIESLVSAENVKLQERLRQLTAETESKVNRLTVDALRQIAAVAEARNESERQAIGLAEGAGADRIANVAGLDDDHHLT